MQLDLKTFIALIETTSGTYAPPRVVANVPEAQIPILSRRDCNTHTSGTDLDNDDSQAIRSVQESIVEPNALFYADGFADFGTISEHDHIVDLPVKLSTGIRLADHACLEFIS